MLTPTVGTLWRYRGQGPAHGDIQRVIWSEYDCVVTISEGGVYLTPGMWSWLGPQEQFMPNFIYVGPATEPSKL